MLVICESDVTARQISVVVYDMRTEDTFLSNEFK